MSGLNFDYFTANGFTTSYTNIQEVCALQWNHSIVDTPGRAENILISGVPSF